MSHCLPAGFALAGDYVRARRAAEEHMNSWCIPDWLEREVKERDKFCVYCGIQLIEQMPSRGARRGVATWNTS